MKAFWIKVINLAVICLILFIYQTSAHSNAVLSASVDELKEKLVQQEEEQGEGGAVDPSDYLYKDGTYEGTGNGYKGEIRMKVTVEKGEITAIETVESSDDEAYFSLASGLIEDIIAGQTTEDVDTVSGATFSSKGILEAVDDALKEAEN